MIKLNGICKQYNGRAILQNVSLRLPAGHMYALVGRSGSGKTTLINILAGLVESDSGSYIFDGKTISGLSTARRDAFRMQNAGLIVQDYALISSISAHDNITLPIRYKRGLARREVNKQAEVLAETLGIHHLLDKRVALLSGGECQRIAIARALIKEPKLILADEPTGALDSDTEKDILALFRQLRNTDRTLILATHSDHVAACCDSVIHIDDGQVVQGW